MDLLSKYLTEANSSGEKAVVNGKATTVNNVDAAAEDMDYKDEDVFQVDKPTEDDINYEFDLDSANENLIRLIDRVRTDRPFFIQGKAGWGKTSIIEQVAKKFGYTVITVFLDKAEATDLGGVPVPVKRRSGYRAVQNLMPLWAIYMLEHPDEKFLLFFDEMNQAAPDVMNALMPIVQKREVCNHKFKNMIVGAAGNLEEENRDGLSALSGPLRSRFKPIIMWETNTEEAWDAAFKYIHKACDKTCGKELVDTVEEHAMMFENPREVQVLIIEWAAKKAQDASYGGKSGWVRDSLIRDHIEACLAEEPGDRYTKTTTDAAVDDLCEYITKYIEEGGAGAEIETTGSSDQKRRGDIGVFESYIKILENDLKKGYTILDGVKYGVSLEDISSYALQDEDGNDVAPTAEQIEYVKKQLEIRESPIKYRTHDEFPPNLKVYTEEEFMKSIGKDDFFDKDDEPKDYHKPSQIKGDF